MVESNLLCYPQIWKDKVCRREESGTLLMYTAPIPCILWRTCSKNDLKVLNTHTQRDRLSVWLAEQIHACFYHLINWKAEAIRDHSESSTQICFKWWYNSMAAEEQCIKYFMIQHSLFISPLFPCLEQYKVSMWSFLDWRGTHLFYFNFTQKKRLELIWVMCDYILIATFVEK